MIFYPIDYIIEELKRDELSVEQISLRSYADENFGKEEAAYVWQRVVDHKWYMGERLERDIGLRVAAIDYIENFYDDSIFRKNDHRRGRFSRLARYVSQTLKHYFVAKSITSSSL